MPVDFDARDLAALRRDLAKADKELGRQLLRRVREAGSVTRDAIAAEAAFSKRIPKSLVTRARYGARAASVKVEARRQIAPHAAPINNRGRAGWFRHPVFAREGGIRNIRGIRDPGTRAGLASGALKSWTWVSQRAVTFMDSGAARSRELAVWRISLVYQDVARTAGFTR